MNHKAIDAGATAFKKIVIPADWADAQDAPNHISLEGRQYQSYGGLPHPFLQALPWHYLSPYTCIFA